MTSHLAPAHPAVAQLLAQAQAQFIPRCELSLPLAEQAADLAARQGDEVGEAAALLLWGRCLLVLQGGEAAQPVLRRALTMATHLGNASARAYANHALAEALASCGDDGRALTHWLDSLEDALQLGLVGLYIEASLGIGNLYVMHEDTPNAFRHHALAAEFSRLHTDQDLRAKAGLHLAADLIKLERFDLAESVLQHAQNDLILPLRRDWQAEIHNYLGDIYLRRQEFERARQHLEEAYQINLETGLVWGQIVNLTGLGKLLLQSGDDTLAEKYLLQALSAVERLHAPHLVQQIHEQLAALYEHRGDDVRAVMHYIGYHEHYMQRINQGISGRLAQLSSRRLANLEIRLRLLGSEFELNRLREAHRETDLRVQALQDAAYRDALTNVMNRRALDESLPGMIEAAQQTGEALCMLVLDFDHFKQINDTWSHQVGDQVLRTGAGLLQASLREHDLAARYGGEEFVLVLRNTPLAVAENVAERIRNRIDAHDWGLIERSLHVSVSVGVAEWLPAESSAAWFSRADAALYDAKRRGRNRVAVAGTGGNR